MTPLSIAAGGSNIEIVELLITYGAEVNAQCSDSKYTPLHMALIRSYYKLPVLPIIKLLIKSGADVTIKASNNVTPLGMIVSKNIDVDDDVEWHNFNELGVKDKDNYYLTTAICCNFTKTVEFLLRKGINSNIPDKNGIAPLQHAVLKGNLKLVKLLIDYKADVNAKSNDHTTALHMALNQEPVNKEVVKLLIKKDADINIIDKNGEKPLDLMKSKNIYIEGISCLHGNSTEITITDPLEQATDDVVLILGNEEIGGKGL